MELNDLPNEVLLHVFSFLREPKDLLNVRDVCWRWLDLSKCKSAWKGITASCSGENDNDNTSFFDCIHVAPMVGTLAFRSLQADNSSQLILKVLNSPLPCIKKLSISRSQMKREHLNALLRRFADQVVKLEFIGVYWINTYDNFFQKKRVFIREFVDTFPNLKFVSTNLRGFGKGAFRMLGCNWPSLERVDLGHMHYESLNHGSLLDLTQSHKLLFDKQHQLKSLVLPRRGLRGTDLDFIPKLISNYYNLNSLTATFSGTAFKWRSHQLQVLDIYYKFRTEFSLSCVTQSPPDNRFQSVRTLIVHLLCKPHREYDNRPRFADITFLCNSFPNVKTTTIIEHCEVCNYRFKMHFAKHDSELFACDNCNMLKTYLQGWRSRPNCSDRHNLKKAINQSIKPRRCDFCYSANKKRE